MYNNVRETFWLAGQATTRSTLGQKASTRHLIFEAGKTRDTSHTATSTSHTATRKCWRIRCYWWLWCRWQNKWYYWNVRNGRTCDDNSWEIWWDNREYIRENYWGVVGFIKEGMVEPFDVNMEELFLRQWWLCCAAANFGRMRLCCNVYPADEQLKRGGTTTETKD